MKGINSYKTYIKKKLTILLGNFRPQFKKFLNTMYIYFQVEATNKTKLPFPWLNDEGT